jgi:hypothetical protein
MKDEGFSSILQGLSRLQDIKSINYSKNEFGVKSASELRPIIL